MRRTATFILMMAVAAVLLPISVLAPSAQAAQVTTTAASLPGGRSTYVVSLMGGTNLHMYSYLATYLFSTNGSVTKRYWYWRQDSISGYSNAARWKPATGYTTSGCRRVCPVRTPLGFQPGTSPRTAPGTWKIDAYGHLKVQWTATAYETWRMNSSQPGFTTLTIMTAYQSEQIQKGWAFGSNASPDRGASLAQVYATRQIIGPLATNAYAVPTKYYSGQSFYWPGYSQCAGGRCLEANTNTAADKRSWYNSYIAGNPAVDGRKNYWNSQSGSVMQAENPGSVCIGYGGGHTNAALQIIDDSGRIRGWIGAEASFDRRSYGQAVVSAWVGVLPAMLSTISSQP